ncbi:complex I subunit 1/NuoH family protein [Stratiformator vulcanicus]|uniref:NADH-quinone oxidoreductase subunit H n=1 Tax=Stratiformator vulcanicus TaxID=2527980 RepID=A0A517QZU8_9PLAN|nr:complex I subunit 1 family protein [Stratiformator vulcanicus]QDT37177.1 NADH-quinone oxidoreductase subunit 8 [Stratiformator vulcanicus]
MPAPLFGATIAEMLSGQFGLPEALAIFTAAAIHAFVLINLFGLVPLVAIWAERKVSGRIQDRLGPTRVGGKFGWLQGLADGIKLIQKEDLAPASADRWLFRMAPYLAAIAAFGGFLVLPFSRDWVAYASSAGLFLLLAIVSIGVVGIVFAGYASGSKWSLFGGMREAAQMVSYEIPLSICAVIPVVAVGSLDLSVIGETQSGWFFPNWLVFHNPFVLIAFIIYFTVATAECKRAPFDLAEAESELVGGFHTEYASMRWALFMLAEYGHMFLVSVIAAVLFLGAWFSGIPLIDGAIGSLRTWSPDVGIEGLSIGAYLANAVGASIVLAKGGLGVIVQIWVRWTLPRLRIDQVMATCLKYLIPISCFLFLGTILWPLVLATTLGRTSLLDYPTALTEPIGVRAARAAAASPANRASHAAEGVPASDEEDDGTPDSGSGPVTEQFKKADQPWLLDSPDSPTEVVE